MYNLFMFARPWFNLSAWTTYTLVPEIETLKEMYKVNNIYNWSFLFYPSLFYKIDWRLIFLLSYCVHPFPLNVLVQ